MPGASSGLGAHCARLFALAGAQVVVGARRLDRVQALADELMKGGLDIVTGGTDTHLSLLDLRDVDVTGADTTTATDAASTTAANRSAVTLQ